MLKYYQDTARALLSPLNWQGLQLNAELCHFMSKQCILCAKTCPAPREHTRHIRLEHSSLAAAAIKQQAAWTYSNAASPCAFCETSFKHTHQCPVKLQLALLAQAEGASTEEQIPLTATPRVCMHCAQMFGTQTALTQHIEQEHSHYSAARDPDNGCAVCVHCKQTFHDTWGLRRHINRQMCVSFDLHLDPLHTIRNDTNLKLLLLQGDVEAMLTDPDTSLYFTQLCVICHQQCTRTVDLIRHLQQQHPEHFRASDLYHQVLLELCHHRG